MRGTVLLLAAGEGARLGGGEPKAFVALDGVTLLRRSADAAAAASRVDAVVAAVPTALVGRARDELRDVDVPCTVVAGGATRRESCAAALGAAKGAPAVAVHDAARALCAPALFDAALSALDDAPAACVVVPVADTVKLTQDGAVGRTLPRDGLVAAQTPQAFRAGVLEAAHRGHRPGMREPTDDASMVESMGVRVVLVAGSARNIKITTPDDLVLAAALLRTATPDGGR